MCNLGGGSGRINHRLKCLNYTIKNKKANHNQSCHMTLRSFQNLLLYINKTWEEHIKDGCELGRGLDLMCEEMIKNVVM